MSNRATGQFPSPSGRGVRGEGRRCFSRGPGMTIRARYLRANMTDSEVKLWDVLRRDALGTRFRRQVVFEQSYILDFYAPALKLCIEVDGGQHAVLPEQDEARSRDLNASGVTVLRFWNNDVLANIEGVTLAILDVIRYLEGASPLTPLPEGGGNCIALSERFQGLRISFGREM